MLPISKDNDPSLYPWGLPATRLLLDVKTHPKFDADTLYVPVFRNLLRLLDDWYLKRTPIRDWPLTRSLKTRADEAFDCLNQGLWCINAKCEWVYQGLLNPTEGRLLDIGVGTSMSFALWFSVT
jgi:hypothetical protein